MLYSKKKRTYAFLNNGKITARLSEKEIKETSVMCELKTAYEQFATYICDMEQFCVCLLCVMLCYMLLLYNGKY